MAIPSGSGTEVLRNFAVNANSAATAKIDWGGSTGTGSVRSSGNTAGTISVPTNVIITILTVGITASASVATMFGTIDWQGSGTAILVFKNYNLADNTTFIFNDKIVLREGDVFKIYTSASCDIWGSFIYQDWT
jgi:hypothetical protein